ncbi:uncharacterized protein ACRADG_002870 [Cochliomyia hominivorax]
MSATQSVLSYQPHMPQVLSPNTVLPDTLKVPIISNMLLPAMAGQMQDNSNIKATPIMIQTPQVTGGIATATTTATTRITPIQTPTLTKHLNDTTIAATTKRQCSKNSEGTSSNNNNNNTNANHTEIHNIINSTNTNTKVTKTTPTTATTSDILHTVVTITTQPTVTTTIVNTPPLSVRCTQVPKSPPRWPLRPGVMVHVSSDTKENLAVNRMTLKPSTTKANLTVSTVNDSTMSSSTLNNTATANNTQTTLLNVTQQSSSSNTMSLGRIGRQSRVQTTTNDEQDLALKVGETNDEQQQPQQQQLTLSQTLPLRGKQFKTITATTTNLTVKRNREETNLNKSLVETEQEIQNTMELSPSGNNNAEEDIEEQEMERNSAPETSKANRNNKLSNFQKVELFFSNIFFKRSTKSDGCRDSQRSHVGLLGGKFWKRSEVPKSPFSTEHRLKGIRSSGSVTYKKCAKTAATKTDLSASSSENTNTNTSNTVTSATITSSNSLNNNNINENDCEIPSNIEQQTITNTLATKAQAQQQTPKTPQNKHNTSQQTLQQQQQHPLPVSMISMLPSSNINHPVRIEQGDLVNVTMPQGDKSITTVIQSIPSTIVTSREIIRNPSQRSVRKGILKAPTPPPRPPPITRTPVKVKNEQVQSKIFWFLLF